jgi:hypothetical protein
MEDKPALYKALQNWNIPDISLSGLRLDWVEFQLDDADLGISAPRRVKANNIEFTLSTPLSSKVLDIIRENAEHFFRV